jgi:predicted thioesterase
VVKYPAISAGAKGKSVPQTDHVAAGCVGNSVVLTARLQRVERRKRRKVTKHFATL